MCPQNVKNPQGHLEKGRTERQATLKMVIARVAERERQGAPLLWCSEPVWVPRTEESHVSAMEKGQKDHSPQLCSFKCSWKLISHPGCVHFRGCCNNLPQTWWLKNQKFVFSHFWRPEIWNQDARRLTLPPTALEEGFSLLLLPSGGSRSSLAGGQIIPTFVSIIHWPYLCVVLLFWLL